ncbi:D-beta-hydroxybutyrate dehydrogenase, mitochondrial isoform X2 [Artibeus jamaicensis]|uniref:D-beta-hydroxybutyrate dehydrogenase, mitochondrial isoform X2 n=1 Tax=Artibeus jamaicensis TaxID=9417 RepID=UPI00187C81FC|nr:D-beta-hydroxybutyrate dehydrogenase, mitochondrial isoform X2 [Artibeus jamaicensis]
MATMLTARLSRPLSKLPGKTPSFPDRESGTRCTLQFYSASFVPVGHRTYADAVTPVGSKAVLVTGCDSGFGFSLAKHLHSKGFLVFAGCLMKDKGDVGAKELDSLKSDRLRTVQLNVCKSEEVERVVEIVRASLEDPEKGRVINIGSMLGRIPYPARSSYCITKFGVEAFSDCLRYEMHPLGVKVCVVEPGNFIAATSLYSPERIQAIANKLWDELPEVVRKDYDKKCFDEKTATMRTYCNSGSTDISPVINAITHALTAAKPYTRYHPMDYYWWLRMQIVTHLPGAISDRIYIH